MLSSIFLHGFISYFRNLIAVLFIKKISFFSSLSIFYLIPATSARYSLFVSLSPSIISAYEQLQDIIVCSFQETPLNVLPNELLTLLFQHFSHVSIHFLIYLLLIRKYNKQILLSLLALLCYLHMVKNLSKTIPPSKSISPAFFLFSTFFLNNFSFYYCTIHLFQYSS